VGVRKAFGPLRVGDPSGPFVGREPREDTGGKTFERVNWGVFCEPWMVLTRQVSRIREGGIAIQARLKGEKRGGFFSATTLKRSSKMESEYSRDVVVRHRRLKC